MPKPTRRDRAKNNQQSRDDATYARKRFTFSFSARPYGPTGRAHHRPFGFLGGNQGLRHVVNQRRIRCKRDEAPAALAPPAGIDGKVIMRAPCLHKEEFGRGIRRIQIGCHL